MYESFGLQKLKRYHCTTTMQKKRKTYTILQKISSIFLMLTLAWLTISAPFVATAQQELAKQQKAFSASSPVSDSEDETTDTGSNAVEEKVSCNAFAEEFLHDHHLTHYLSSETSRYHKLENAGTYTAFHGELLVPPPNAA